MESTAAHRVVGLLAGDLWKRIRTSLLPYTREEIIEDVRRSWDQDIALFGRESREARELHDLTVDDRDRIDERIWVDLDLPILFRELDFTATDIGQQYLYRMLRQFREEARLRSDYAVVKRLQTDAEARESILVELHPLGSSDLDAATRLLFGKVAKPTHRKLLVCAWSTGMTTLTVSTLLLGGWLWYAALPALVVNLIACQWFTSRTDRLSYAYHVLYQMLCVADAISRRRDLGHLPACADLEALRPDIVTLKRRSLLLALSQASPNLFVAQPMHLVNLLTAIEPLLHTFNADRLDRCTDILCAVYEAIGSLEASIAVARYAERYPLHCNPCLVDGATIELRAAYHPLIPDPVPNDFDSTGRSALITGSNMAGKTSFIKTVGVNFVLARTLWICHAEHARFPPLGVATSIRTTDGIREGRSYYFAELERVLEFLEDGSMGTRGKLLLVDEIYRGTNTVERIAGAAAVLHELSKRHTVLVTTHDTELSGLLSGRYSMLYFDETGEVEQPFDYRLKVGVCRTRNALKLMGKIGYPAHVVERALQIAEKIDAGGATAGMTDDGAVDS